MKKRFPRTKETEKRIMLHQLLSPTSPRVTPHQHGDILRYRVKGVQGGLQELGRSPLALSKKTTLEKLVLILGPLVREAGTVAVDLAEGDGESLEEDLLM